MLQAVSGELRRFGETTSVRGIPRALKSKDRGLVVLWSAGVIVCAAMLLWQISWVFVRYYQYEYVTVVGEDNQHAVFPDITICKVYQMNTLFSKSMNWSKYVSDTRARFRRWPIAGVQSVIPDVTAGSYGAIWQILLSKDGYYASLPIDVGLMENSRTADNPFVIYCNTTNWNSMTDWSCLESVRPRWDPMYYRCFTVEIADSVRRNISSLSTVLYLDDFDQPANKDSCCPNAFRSQSSGIRISVHDRQTPPDMSRGVSASPGTETTVLVSEVDRHRLEEPHGDCVNADRIGDVDDELGYSVRLCQEICSQNLTVAACGCIDPQTSFTGVQLRSVNGTVCGNQTSVTDNNVDSNHTAHDVDGDDLRGFRGLHCLNSALRSRPPICSESCRRPCFERLYTASVSASGPWPQPAFQLDFYRLFIRQSKFADKFGAYEEIFDAVRNGTMSPTQVVSELGELDAITSNFIQLNVVLDQAYPYVVADKPEMTVDGLLSSMGGSLSLWLGMTIMFAFELLDLIYTIAANYWRRGTKTKKKKEEEEESHDMPSVVESSVD